MTYSKREQPHKSRAAAFLSDERITPKVRNEQVRRGGAPSLSKPCSGPRTARHSACYAVNCPCPCHAEAAS